MHWSDSFVQVCTLGVFNTPWINVDIEPLLCEGYAPPSAFFIFCIKILDEERQALSPMGCMGNLSLRTGYSLILAKSTPQTIIPHITMLAC